MMLYNEIMAGLDRIFQHSPETVSVITAKFWVTNARISIVIASKCCLKNELFQLYNNILIGLESIKGLVLMLKI